MEKINHETAAIKALREFQKEVSAGKWVGRESEAEKEGDRLIKALLTQTRK